MVDSLVSVESEAVSGFDVDGGGGGSGGAADVAAQVRGGESGDGAVVVCVFAQVLVDGKFLAIETELLEDVVRGDEGGGEEGEGEGCELHGGWGGGMMGTEAARLVMVIVRQEG